MSTSQSPTERTNSPEIEVLPTDVESPKAKLVYLYLRRAEESTVDEMRTVLGLRTITLYPVLSGLVEKGLVRRDGETYVRQSP